MDVCGVVFTYVYMYVMVCMCAIVHVLAYTCTPISMTWVHGGEDA